jgi:hypothetical protein
MKERQRPSRLPESSWGVPFSADNVDPALWDRLVTAVGMRASLRETTAALRLEIESSVTVDLRTRPFDADRFDQRVEDIDMFIRRRESQPPYMRSATVLLQAVCRIGSRYRALTVAPEGRGRPPKDARNACIVQACSLFRAFSSSQGSATTRDQQLLLHRQLRDFIRALSSIIGMTLPKSDHELQRLISATGVKILQPHIR